MLSFKYCQALADTIIMRFFALLLFFGMFVNSEAAPRGKMEQPGTDKIFTIPKVNPDDTANDAASVEPPAEIAVDTLADTTVETSAETAVKTPVETAVVSGGVFHQIDRENMPVSQRFIMGKGETGAELLASFLLNENNKTDREFAAALAGFYIAEAKAEGVNHDIAFAQMCLETGFLRFGGLVTAEMNNFCGLGSIGPGEEGEWFSSPELGVRAHIQHLKAYASSEPLEGELVDPRYRFVRRGAVPFVQGLAGTWAADKLYAEKIELILERLYRFRDTASE